MNREHYCRLLVLLAPACLMAGQARADYTETNLISNEVGVAPITDANLVDPWGLAFSATSPLWVSNQGSGTATVYKITGTSSSATQLTEGVANIAGAPPSNANGPTGQVSTAAPGVTTGATDFQVNGGKASFIFDNLDSSISAWRGGMTSSLITATVTGASFTGLAIGNTSTGAAQIYAADQNSGNVDIFNNQWQQVGALTDPNLPAGFTAFNVQNIGGTLYVTYANPNDALGGVVDEFNTNGTMITRLITDPSGTNLQSPWGVASRRVGDNSEATCSLVITAAMAQSTPIPSLVSSRVRSRSLRIRCLVNNNYGASRSVTVAAPVHRTSSISPRGIPPTRRMDSSERSPSPSLAPPSLAWSPSGSSREVGG